MNVASSAVLHVLPLGMFCFAQTVIEEELNGKTVFDGLMNDIQGQKHVDLVYYWDGYAKRSEFTMAAASGSVQLCSREVWLIRLALFKQTATNS